MTCLPQLTEQELQSVPQVEYHAPALTWQSWVNSHLLHLGLHAEEVESRCPGASQVLHLDVLPSGEDLCRVSSLLCLNPLDVARAFNLYVIYGRVRACL